MCPSLACLSLDNSIFPVGNDTPQSMADPWSSKPELRLNLCVYILCMVGGIIGNISVILIMIRQKTSRKLHSDTWKTNLFLLSLSVGFRYSRERRETCPTSRCPTCSW